MFDQAYDDLRAGLSYVRYSDRLLTTIVTGALLLNFGYLVAPVIVLMGYFVFVIQRSVDGTERPPRFRDWRTLLVDGTKAAIIGLVYVNFSFVIVGVSVNAVFSVSLSDMLKRTQRVGRAVLEPETVAEIQALDELAPVLWLLVGFYLFPAGLAQFSLSEGRHVRSGLKFDPFLTLLSSPRYLSAWLVGFAFLAVGVLAVLLPASLMPAWLLLEQPSYGSSPLSLAAIFCYNLLQLLGYAIFFTVQISFYHVIARAWRDVYPTEKSYRSRTVYKRRINHTLDEWSSVWERPESVDIRQSPLRWPLTNARRNIGNERTALIGGSTVLLGDILLPLLLLGGYLGRVLRRGSSETEPLPTFDRWRLLLSDGSKMLLVWLGYVTVPVLAVVYWRRRLQVSFDVITVLGSVYGGLAIIPLRVMATGVINILPEAGSLTGGGTEASVPVTAGEIGAGSGGSLSLALVLFGIVVLAFYLLPAALANCARNRSVTSGFAFRKIALAVVDRTYAEGWIRAIAIAVLGWMPMLSVLVFLPEQATTPVATFRSGVFEERLSIAILPLDSIREPELIAVHALLLVCGIVFFYFQIAAFYLIGNASKDVFDPTAAANPPALTGGNVDEGTLVGNTAFTTAGRAGMVGGALLAMFAFGLVLSVQSNSILVGLLKPVGLLFYLAFIAHPVAFFAILGCTIGYYLRFRREKRAIRSVGLLLSTYFMLVLCVASIWFVYFLTGDPEPILVNNRNVEDFFVAQYLNLVVFLFPYLSAFVAYAGLRGRNVRFVGFAVVGLLFAVVLPIQINQTIAPSLFDRDFLGALYQFMMIPLGLIWIALGHSLRRTNR